MDRKPKTKPDAQTKKLVVKTVRVKRLAADDLQQVAGGGANSRLTQPSAAE
jgi:hypothetical protein